MMLLPPALRLLAKAIVGGWLVYLHASWLGWHFQQPTAGTWTVVLHDDGGTAIEMGRAASDGVAATFTDAAEALLRISARAGDAEQADAWVQLAWQYNKVALDQAEEHKPRGAHHRLAATRAVDIAAKTWPYWLSWPETQNRLAEALGMKSIMAAIDAVRLRFAAQRWQSWWREEQPGWSNTTRMSLPQPRVLAPFSSLLMFWQLHEPTVLDSLLSGSDGAAEAADCNGDTSEEGLRGGGALERGDMALLTQAALRLHNHAAAGVAAAARGGEALAGKGDTPNEALYKLQNSHHNKRGRSLFSDEGELRELLKPGQYENEGRQLSDSVATQTVEAFDRLTVLFRAAAAAFLEQHGLSAAEVEQRIRSREIFIWASVHQRTSSHTAHIHEMSGVSGVLYTAIPENNAAAELRFEDPRGGHMLLEQLGGAGAVPGTGLPREFPTVAPPFYQHLRVAPVQGQLVAFPGWLVHAVVAAGGTDDGGRGNGKGDSNRPGEEGDNEWRVSFSFNLHGEWEDTSTLLLEQ